MKKFKQSLKQECKKENYSGLLDIFTNKKSLSSGKSSLIIFDECTDKAQLMDLQAEDMNVDGMKKMCSAFEYHE